MRPVRTDDGGRFAAVRSLAYVHMQRYLAETRRYPLLTREEERELAIRYFCDKDLEAAYRLVASNLRLVVMLAREYQKASQNLLDLIQEGNIGLMEAVKNFDPYRGVRFPSYAVWWIRAYIIRYIMNNWRMVKLGTTQAQRKLFFNLQKEKELLERRGAAARETAEDSGAKAENRRLGLILGWAAGFCLAVYLLGFYISIPVFAFAYLKWRRRGWLAAAIFAIALLAFSYAVFAIGLKVPLYKGLIFGAH